jgi:hypothetical protein
VQTTASMSSRSKSISEPLIVCFQTVRNPIPAR